VSQQTAEHHLSDGGGQHAHNLLMRHSNHTLTINVNDSMSNPHTTTLCYASPQQATDLSAQTHNHLPIISTALSLIA